MVEKAPIVVKQGLKKDEAEKLKATLLEAGGKAELL
jgi:ribosomal protein L7/L12